MSAEHDGFIPLCTQWLTALETGQTQAAVALRRRAIEEARPYRSLFPLGAPDRD